MYSDYYYGSDLLSTTSRVAGNGLWAIIAFVIALAATVCLFVIFLNKKNEKKFKGFLGWMYDFLNFKTMLINMILKATYLCLAIFITLYSFALIGTSFVSFLVTLIFGNLLLRIGYELTMLMISICANVAEINKKLK